MQPSLSLTWWLWPCHRGPESVHHTRGVMAELAKGSLVKKETPLIGDGIDKCESVLTFIFRDFTGEGGRDLH